MKTPEEALDALENVARCMEESIFNRSMPLAIRRAVKILKPLATQDRERLALTQHWRS